MSRQYYYLVTSLPDLTLDAYKEAYRVREFAGELAEQSSGAEREYLRSLLDWNDNRLVIDALLRRAEPWASPPGNYDFSEIKRRLDEKDYEGFPEYLCRFLTEQEAFSEKEKSPGNLEMILAERYFGKMIRHENCFLREYFRFELNLRNVKAALTGRRFNLKPEFCRPDTESAGLAEKLASSTAADFGLGHELDFIPVLVETFEKDDPVHWEKTIDLLRWKEVDDLNTPVYFNIDVLLGYLLKLILVERWIHLEPHRGREVFEQRVKIDRDNLFSHASGG